jgi:protein TonB
VFDFTLGQEKVGRSGLKTGMLISAAIHAGVIAGVLFISSQALVDSRKMGDVPLPLVIWRNPGQVGGGGSESRTDDRSNRSAVRPRREQTRPLHVSAISPVIAKTDAIPKPPAEAPEPALEGPPDGRGSSLVGPDDPGGGPGDGNCVGADCADGRGPLDNSRPMLMGPGMVPPRLLYAGERIQYTRQASEARVKGVMEVQCILTVGGRVTSCRVLQAVPLMEEAVVRALMSRRYTPVLFQGKPVPVKYNFAIELKAAD